MDKCELCSRTDMIKCFCESCYWKAYKESYHAMRGDGKFDTIDHELQNVKDELKQIRELLNDMIPKKKEIKHITKDLW